jgi:hypothetical protein
LKSPPHQRRAIVDYVFASHLNNGVRTPLFDLRLRIAALDQTKLAIEHLAGTSPPFFERIEYSGRRSRKNTPSGQ